MSDFKPGALNAVRFLRAKHFGLAAMSESNVTANGLIGNDAAVAFASSQNWAGERQIVQAIKSAVPGSSGPDPGLRPVMVDLIHEIEARSVLGRLPGLTRVPIGSALLGLGVTTTATWTADGAAIRASRVAFEDQGRLRSKHVGALLVIRNEALRDSSINVERALVRDLIRAGVQAVDDALLNPANQGSEAVPAAITADGDDSISSMGSTPAAVESDLREMLAMMAAAGSSLANCVFVMAPQAAVFLAGLRDGEGGPHVFPNMGATGGTILGVPAITSTNIPVAQSDSPGPTTNIVLIDGERLTVGDDNDLSIDLSNASVIEMDDEPTGNSVVPTAASAHRVGMFQTNTSAIKVLRWVDWRPRRTRPAVVLTDLVLEQ